MYKRTQKLMYLVFVLALPTLLTACGGASPDEGAAPSGGGTVNKPDINSSVSSAAPRSSTASSTLSSVAASSLALAPSSRSTSSSSYARVSRSSQSSTSEDSRPGFDLLAPEATKLHLYRLSENSITLVWDESFDNVGISHYEIKRNGKMTATFEDASQILSDQNLSSNTEYTYTITAFDLAGNDSGPSIALTVRTLDDPNAPVQASSSLSSSSSSVKNSSIQSSLTSSSSSKSASSASSISSSKSTSSAASSAASQKSAKLTWSHPNQRENGQFLELNEIGGYEIRYRKITDTRYTYIVLNSNRITEYTLANANDTEFEIAVFDSNGVYSRFVKVTQ